MNKKGLNGIIIGAVAIVLIAAAVTIGIVVASKLTCKHDNQYEIEILPYKAATCQEEGLTSGKKCNYCGEILVEQKIINKTECKESAWIVNKESTLTEDGEKHTECTICGKVIQRQIIYAGTQGLEYELNQDGTYTLDGDGSKAHSEIVIPSMYNGQRVTNIGTHAFMNSSAKSITIPNTVKTIQAYAFSGCSKLENIVIPAGVQSISYYCFKSCKSLKNIDIPDTVKLIDHSAFWGCTSLKTINLPDSGTEIEAYAFKGCTSLVSIDIPYGMKRIDNGTFFGCTSITTIILPSSLIAIDAEAFYNCTSLTTIKFEGTVEQWNTISFGTSWRAYVPAPEVICSNGTVKLK